MSIYSCDYRDMTLLREITNRHKLTLLLIHHTRKMSDPDPLNTLSGSTGLVGSVDGVFVLEKEKRTSHNAKLTIANRDTEGFCFMLELDTVKCKWRFIGSEVEVEEESNDWLVSLVDNFLQEEWRGSATELSEALKQIAPDADITELSIKKKLKNIITLLCENGITVNFDDRDSKKRWIILTRQSE